MKKSSAVLIIFSLLLLVGASFLSVFFMKKGRDRVVMYFTAYDSDDVCTEVRYLPKNSVQGDVALLVDELLLGPMTNRYKRLFASGTRAEFCMVQDDVLYVGLSKDALSYSGDAADLKTGIELLKVNIVKKFTKIKTVLVYIDGKAVYEEN